VTVKLWDAAKAHRCLPCVPDEKSRRQMSEAKYKLKRA
jgi:hypothetical protein